MEKNKVTVTSGFAALSVGKPAAKVTVDGKAYDAKHVILASGGRH